MIHCQGSTSFMMCALAGLVPQVTTIVSNAVSLHPIVSRLAKLKLRYLIPATARVLGYLDPQWGRDGAPWLLPKLLEPGSGSTHHECDNRSASWSSYTYGIGKPTLWRHENLNPLTHEWLRDEFGAVPLTFFSRSCAASRPVICSRSTSTPSCRTTSAPQPPATDARFAFLAGAMNTCFTADSQRATHAWFDRPRPRRHTLHVFAGYGHLDVFMGRRAAEDIFPTIVAELEEDAETASPATPSVRERRAGRRDPVHPAG